MDQFEHLRTLLAEINVPDREAAWWVKSYMRLNKLVGDLGLELVGNQKTDNFDIVLRG